MHEDVDPETATFAEVAAKLDAQEKRLADDSDAEANADKDDDDKSVAEDDDDKSVAEDDDAGSLAAEGELEKVLDEVLENASATSGVDAPEERTADPETEEAPDIPPETSGVDAPDECAADAAVPLVRLATGKGKGSLCSKAKYADHKWSDSENDIPGTSTEEGSCDEHSRNANHRHNRERRERVEDDQDNEMIRTGQAPPERNRWKQSPLRSRNDRYKAQMKPKSLRRHVSSEAASST